jgi:hypothetical protein
MDSIKVSPDRETYLGRAYNESPQGAFKWTARFTVIDFIAFPLELQRRTGAILFSIYTIPVERTDILRDVSRPSLSD